MKIFRLILIVLILSSSCNQRKEPVPKKIMQFSENAIEASINTYPLTDFYNNTYFDHRVPKEYLDKLNTNAIIWRGLEHNSELREANFINKLGKRSEYLLKYWVTFKDDSRKFSYSISVLEKEGKMTLKRFEPLNVDIASTFYSPNTKLDVPNFEANKTKILLAQISILASFLIIIILALWKRKYLLFFSIPLLFVYKTGTTTYHFKGIDTISPEIHFGLPIFENIDLHFTHLNITQTGVFYTWAIVIFYLIGSFIVKKTHLHNNTYDLKTKANYS